MGERRAGASIKFRVAVYQHRIETLTKPPPNCARSLVTCGRWPPLVCSIDFSSMSQASDSTRQYSSIVHDGPDRAPNRSMLRAVGFKDEDFKKPVVGIASTWSMVTPCNMHIDKLAIEAGRGVDNAGGKSIIFNTITVSDGISMGTLGMRYSLVSREVIADSVETVAGAE